MMFDELSLHLELVCVQTQNFHYTLEGKKLVETTSEIDILHPGDNVMVKGAAMLQVAVRRSPRTRINELVTRHNCHKGHFIECRQQS